MRRNNHAGKHGGVSNDNRLMTSESGAIHGRDIPAARPMLFPYR
jgi:hypothetical protein